MAASLGLKSVAEIVETPEAAQDLQRMGCNYAQGFLYCKPVEAELAFQWFRPEGSQPAVEPTAAASATTTEDDSPTVMIPQDSLMMLDETLMLPAESVAEKLREQAQVKDSRPNRSRGVR